MTSPENATLFLRLEGPLQSWGDSSRHVLRQTRLEPTRSGVIGLLCCALGRKRDEPITDLAVLTMGVRTDRPGMLIRDYHTVGAKIGCCQAQGGIKRTQSTGEIETFVTVRNYLADASFLVVLQGPVGLMRSLAAAVRSPRWPPFLGRKSCVPAVPLFEDFDETGNFPDTLAALKAQPWRARLSESDEELPAADRSYTDRFPTETSCTIECEPDHPEAQALPDLPLCFQPRRFALRFVREVSIVLREGPPIQRSAPPFSRARQNYRTRHWKEMRAARSKQDGFLCVFCGVPSSTVHHVTYERANCERLADLRSMCRACHDAVTMLETESGMGLLRLDPLAPENRSAVLRRRDDILRNRRS
jgi:CRISPR system Cascade subunit CasD